MKGGNQISKIFTLGSLFDGIGGFPYAASFYGIRALWASEILPECVSVTRRHFPDMEHLGDITKLDGRKIPPVDIITFGSPCQGLSLAGQRRGLADERSGLFMEAIRIIDEMREVTHGRYPRFAIWENVPGALSSNGRRDYKAVLEAFTKSKIPMPGSGRWASAGMVRSRSTDIAWCVYDAQHFGTAQRRRRLFLVADFRGTCAGEILFVPKSLRGYFEKGGTPRQGLAAFAENSADAAGEDKQLADAPAYCIAGNVISRQDGTGGNGAGFQKEIAYTLTAVDRHAVVAAGFDMCQITSKTNRSTLKPVQPTLCGSGNPHVVTGAVCMGTGQANAAILDNQSPTLTAAHEQPVLVHPQICGTLCASGAGLSRPAGMGSETDFCIASAVDCRNLRETGGISGTLQAKATTGGYSLNYQNPVRIGICVRRLTPLEAERLMGFPDFWTEKGADGKIISDSKRYSMLGNSVAVPCVAYIMQGIREVVDRE